MEKSRLLSREELDKEISDCERYIEMFTVIIEGYQKKLNRLKKEIQNDITRR